MMTRNLRNHIFYSIVIFTRESSYCFQRVLAIAILSVRPSVTRWISQKRCKLELSNLYRRRFRAATQVYIIHIVAPRNYHYAIQIENLVFVY